MKVIIFLEDLDNIPVDLGLDMTDLEALMIRTGNFKLVSRSNFGAGKAWIE